MRWKKLLGATLLLCFSQAPAVAAPVDDFIRAEMKRLNIPGLSLAVIKDRKIVKLTGYGMANLETQTPATPDTVYKIASLSKPILAAGILLLAEDGRIRLDDRINSYLDNSPASWSGITIRHVLTHTSGIPRDPADYLPYQQQETAAVITRTYALPLVFQPGERFLYSNVGYFILARIIEKTTTRPWDAFIEERIFKPAGMTETRLLTNAVVPNRASGYDEIDGKLVNTENWIAGRPSAAFLSTARDMARWDIFLDTKNPLTASDWSLARSQTALNDGNKSEYGFGWYVRSYLGHSRLHHDGQYPGFRSDYERFEQDGLSIILLTNAGRPRVDSLALKLAGFFSPFLAAPSFTVAWEKPEAALKSGAPAKIAFTVQAPAKASPQTVLEMEIWDESNKPVRKQLRAGQDFARGENRRIEFDWTPDRPGRFWINLGIYGPGFTPDYSWSQHLGQAMVE